MATISSTIALEDSFSSVLNGIISAVNLSACAIADMQSTMSSSVDTKSIEGIHDQINNATIAAQELEAVMKKIEETANAPTASFQWQSDNLDVFNNTGIERFQQEIQSANDMLNTLNNVQTRITQQAEQTKIFPANMASDLGSMQNRIQGIQARIQAIENNKLNLGTDIANAELERLRASLNQAVADQEALNSAVENMDVEKANAAYLRLSSTVGNTERYIRDNVSEQGRFNKEIEEGASKADNLKSKLAGAVGNFAVAGIKKTVSFIQDCTEAYDTQLNAENQLIAVMSNMLDADYVSKFEIETTADTTAAVDKINAIQGSVDKVNIPVTASGKALQSEFDSITKKASEIQSKGIYGDEAMISGAAEFATYFTDTDAIEMMMDTLSNYAMGMSGGGEIDSTAMTDYATGLGKIMTGSYDAMTKKGFEFTDTQKAIIEGTATQQQIVATLGEEYISLSEDMQAAAVISQVIDESWGGLYETMSNTPEGKIIQLTNAAGDLQEMIGGQLYPYVMLFVDAVQNNWPVIESVASGIVSALQKVMVALSWIANGAINVASFFVDNWSWISPIIWGIVAALAMYATYLGKVKAAELAEKGVKLASVIAQYAYAAATHTAVSAKTADTAAQMGLNTALLACPLTWIVLAIIAVIAIIYAVIGAINKVKGTTVSATGVIFGAITWLGALIIDIVIGLINGIIQYIWSLFVEPFVGIIEWILTAANGGFDSFGDAVANLIGHIISWFLSLGKVVTKIIDAIFGTDWTSGLSSLQDKVTAWGTNENAVKIKLEAPQIERIGLKDAYNKGYDFGTKIDSKVSSIFKANDNVDTGYDFDKLTSGYDALSNDVSDIANNTGKAADSMEITSEDLKYLRDIAETEVVNRFTTAEIRVEMNNNNSISSDMDLDGVVDYLAAGVEEAMVKAAEGVHE